MPRDHALPDLPGFSNEDLRATLLENYGAGSDAGLDDDVRFLAGVVRLIRKLSARTSKAESETPSIFILTEGAPELADPSRLTRAPMLSNGLTPIAGAIWFVGPAVNFGQALPVGEWEDAAVFDEVSRLGVGDRPAVILDPRTPVTEARFYDRGLDWPDECKAVRLGGIPLSLDEIFLVIDNVHQTQLVTSVAQSKAGKLWKNATKYWASDNAEDIVQLYLRSGLISAFPSCVVREEQSQVTGRLDIEIEEPDPGDRSVVIRHALLELKILRAFGNGGSPYSESDTEAWVSEGVNQAYEYREERGTRASALCCFDMRPDVSGDTCFSHVAETAKVLQVTLRVWHIFPSPKALREHRAKARGAG